MVSQRIERLVVSTLLRLPGRLLSRLAGGEHIVDGQALDPQVQMALALYARSKRPLLDTQSPPAARDESRRASAAFAVAPRIMARVRNVEAPGPAGPIPVRIYDPVRVVRSPPPLVVYYHGGGGVIGDLDGYDPSARALAAGSGCAVASVDYRLAPEHPFPAGLEDAVAAYRWLVAGAASLGVDPTVAAVGGDSMGANLALGVARRVRDATAPRLQLLVYPWVDLCCASASHRTFGDGYLLTRALLAWFAAHYLADPARAANPDASPLHAGDLAGLAPAQVVTAGFDPLRDEGRALAARLEQAGVQVSYRNYPSLIHGFFGTNGPIAAARIAAGEIAAELGAALETIRG